MTDNSFLENIQRLQDQYYQKEHKNTFFKKQQKSNCAQEIATQINITELLHRTAFVIPNTNRFWLDYLVFKTYANANNYIDIVTYVMSLIISTVTKYGSFEIHINLQTFSISAADRYKDGVYLFFEECIRLNTTFDQTMTNMYIYHTPSMMDSIFTFFSPVASKEIKSKIIMIGKKESPALIERLLV